MNTDEKYAVAAARLLRQQMAPAPVHEPTDRDRVVAAMELALAQQSRRRRLLRTGYWALAAAAGVVLVLRLTPSGEQPLRVEQIAGQGNLLLRQGETQALAAATFLAEGDEIHAGEVGGATLGMGRGTTLVVSRASQLRVIEAGQARRFLLLHGQVDASVAKLRPNERLLVATPDSEVEVRGTRFSVKVADAPADCGGTGQRSTVDVQEGTVWVRSQGQEKILTAGQSFTRPCAPIPPQQEALAPTPPPAPSTPARATEERKPSASAIRRRSPPSETVRAPAEAPEPGSQLAEQNDLLSAAMAAARAGQHDLAIRRLDTLLARFPEGPLSETARIERKRIKAAQPHAP
jgi:ferric-dicitrate binding protein FerR (iron transport regulator)